MRSAGHRNRSSGESWSKIRHVSDQAPDHAAPFCPRRRDMGTHYGGVEHLYQMRRPGDYGGKHARSPHFMGISANACFLQIGGGSTREAGRASRPSAAHPCGGRLTGLHGLLMGATLVNRFADNAPLPLWHASPALSRRIVCELRRFHFSLAPLLLSPAGSCNAADGGCRVPHARFSPSNPGVVEGRVYRRGDSTSIARWAAICWSLVSSPFGLLPKRTVVNKNSGIQLQRAFDFLNCGANTQPPRFQAAIVLAVNVALFVLACLNACRNRTGRAER